MSLAEWISTLIYVHKQEELLGFNMGSRLLHLDTRTVARKFNMTLEEVTEVLDTYLLKFKQSGGYSDLTVQQYLLKTYNKQYVKGGKTKRHKISIAIEHSSTIYHN